MKSIPKVLRGRKARERRSTGRNNPRIFCSAEAKNLIKQSRPNKVSQFIRCLLFRRQVLVNRPEFFSFFLRFFPQFLFIKNKRNKNYLSLSPLVSL